MQFIATLRSSLVGRQGTIYVLGLAQKAGSDQQAWSLASQRAQVVADIIDQQINGPQSRAATHVYAWGAGPGYQWAGRKGPIANDAQILIAVLNNR